MAQNPQEFLRIIATKFPHPAIQRLVDTSIGNVGTPPGE